MGVPIRHCQSIHAGLVARPKSLGCGARLGHDAGAPPARGSSSAKRTAGQWGPRWGGEAGRPASPLLSPLLVPHVGAVGGPAGPTRTPSPARGHDTPTRPHCLRHPLSEGSAADGTPRGETSLWDFMHGLCPARLHSAPPPQRKQGTNSATPAACRLPRPDLAGDLTRAAGRRWVAAGGHWREGFGVAPGPAGPSRSLASRRSAARESPLGGAREGEGWRRAARLPRSLSAPARVSHTLSWRGR